METVNSKLVVEVCKMFVYIIEIFGKMDLNFIGCCGLKI